MKGKIDIYDHTFLCTTLIHEPQTENTLILIPFKESYYIYHVNIENQKVTLEEGKRFFDPIKFNIINKIEKYPFLEHAEAEISRRIGFDKSLNALMIKEEKPLRKSLNYKLNFAVFLYITYKEMYESRIDED